MEENQKYEEEILGSKLSDVTFEDPFFELLGDNDVLEAKQKIEDWSRAYKFSNPGFYLASRDTGRCKTSIMACAYNVLKEEKFFPVCTNMSDIMRVAKSEPSAYRKLKEAWALFIDDIGIENFTGFKGDEMNAVLYELINYRYNNNLTTCFTSNYGIKDLEKKKSVFKQTVDRIRGMTAGNWIEIQGDSVRERLDLRAIEQKAYDTIVQRRNAEKEAVREAVKKKMDAESELSEAEKNEFVKNFLEKARARHERSIEGSRGPVQGN